MDFLKCWHFSSKDLPTKVLHATPTVMKIIALPDLHEEIGHLEAIAGKLLAVDLVLLG